MKVNGISSTALIYYGAINNFINLAFMKTLGLELIPLDQVLTCRLEEGSTKVTHGFEASLEVGHKKVPTSFM